METVRLKRQSTKLKLLCYVGMNFGIIFFAFVALVDGRSLIQTEFILVGNLVFWNLVLWYLFRQRDKASTVSKSE